MSEPEPDVPVPSDGQPVGEGPSGPDPRLLRRRRRQRRSGWALLLVLALLVATVSWVAVTGLAARRELNQVKAGLVTLRSQLQDGDFSSALLIAKSIAKNADRAHHLTTGPAWWTSSKTPALGDSFESVRGIALAVHEVAQSVLPDVVSAVQALDSKSIERSAGDVDVAAVTRLSVDVSRAAVRARQIQSQVHELPTHTWLAQADSARSELSASLDELVTAVTDISSAVSIAPSLLGAHGPRRYFIGFLNSAEIRGVGGLPGAFAILVANAGKVTFTHFGPDEEMAHLSADVNFGADYDRQYADYEPKTQYLNSTVSPNFPYAAAIWASMWQRKTGERIDGAIALDPTALSYLLGATGPAYLADGTAITSANVVTLTQSTAYSRFGADQSVRKQFLLAIATAADKKVFGSTGNQLALIRAAVRAIDQRRLVMWSATPSEETVLASGSVGGTIKPTSGPYGAAIVNNFAANKLDYYLHMAVVWQRQGCGASRLVTATITLTNDAPRTGLTKYVTGVAPGTAGAGDGITQLDYFATAGAQATGVTLNGKAIATTPGAELGHPVFREIIKLPIGQPQTVVVHLNEPAGAGTPDIVKQPLVHPVQVTVKDERCH